MDERMCEPFFFLTWIFFDGVLLHHSILGFYDDSESQRFFSGVFSPYSLRDHTVKDNTVPLIKSTCRKALLYDRFHLIALWHNYQTSDDIGVLAPHINREFKAIPFLPRTSWDSNTRMDKFL
jgi:hypothetical protein